MHKSLIRKALVVGIIILMIGVNVSSSFARDTDITTMSPVGFDGNTLYVGGSGPNNYTTIQSAIDDAVDGDTVFVYDDSSPYFENVVINKQINLIGEDKNSTIIDGQYFEDVIEIESDNIHISGFTLQSGSVFYGNGIHKRSNIKADNITIIDNIILENYIGIDIYNSSNVCIKQNIINGNFHAGVGIFNSNFISISKNNVSENKHSGLDLYNCDKVDIYNNNICLNDFSGIGIIESTNCILKNNIVKISTYGLILGHIDYCQVISNRIFLCEVFNMQLSYSNHTTFTENIYSDCPEGVLLFFSNFTDFIQNNVINHSKFGILIYNSSNTNVLSNNFKQNRLQAIFYDSQTYWNKNYWGRPMILPKPILGGKLIGQIKQFELRVPQLNFDWRPAQEPYDI